MWASRIKHNSPPIPAPSLLALLLLSVLLGLLSSTVTPTLAHAEDRWSAPYPGVRHLRRVGNGVDYHAILVDLNSASLTVFATRQGERDLPVRDFARRYGADIAINANFFDGNSASCGLAAGDGEIWADSYVEGCSMSFGFGRLNEALAFDSFDKPRGPFPESWMTDVITGKPWLVRDGVVQGGWLEPRHIEWRHPRTAVGLSRDRRTLVLLVADGRRAGVPGLTGYQLAEIMAGLGCHDALNLDGGGSSELFVRSEGGVQNRPSDGRPRAVSNHLGIRFRGGSRWYDGTLEAISPTVTLRAGSEGSLWARYRNTGRAPWRVSGHGAVELAVSDGLPSALFHPDSWLSDTVATGLARNVAPGESVTFEFPVVAPSQPGRYEVAFAPVVRDDGPVPAEAARFAISVREGVPQSVAVHAIEAQTKVHTSTIEPKAAGFPDSEALRADASLLSLTTDWRSWISLMAALSFIGVLVRRRKGSQA